MTTLNPSEEIDLLLRFPFSPKVREIVASTRLSQKADEIKTKHLKESFSANEFVNINNQYNTPTKSIEKESCNENNSSQTELAKMNARLEGLVYSTPKSEKKIETNNINLDIYKYIPTYSFSETKHTETKHVQSLFDTPIKDENILERADKQLLKSRALFTESLSAEKQAHINDLLKVEDLKESKVIEEKLYESQISPEAQPIIEEIKAKDANLGEQEKKTVAKTLNFE